MAFAMSGLAAAQQNGKTIARIVFYQDVPAEQTQGNRPQDLKGALEALRQETRQLQATLKSSADNSAPASSVGQSKWPTERLSAQTPLSDLRPSPSLLDPDPIDGIGNTEDIEERLQLLARIFERNRIERQAKLAEAANVVANDPPAAMQPTPASLRNESINPGAPAMVAPVRGPVTTEDLQPIPASADAVFPNPVNLFEMGNSLYQTGELKTALEAYTQVDRNTITAAEAFWLDFMMASCHRRLGNWDEARKLYRAVANQRVAEKLSKPAQSWLKQLELVSQSKASFTQMEAEISSLIETAQEHVKQ